jgi:hypothetical protein
MRWVERSVRNWLLIAFCKKVATLLKSDRHSLKCATDLVQHVARWEKLSRLCRVHAARRNRQRFGSLENKRNFLRRKLARNRWKFLVISSYALVLLREFLAGAGGIDPADGGIKIRFRLRPAGAIELTSFC